MVAGERKTLVAGERKQITLIVTDNCDGCRALLRPGAEAVYVHPGKLICLRCAR